MNLDWTNRIIFTLSLVGLIVSGYLLYTYVFDSPIVCVNTGCETVRASQYSYFLGIPLPLFGGLMYIGIFALSFARTIVGEDLVRKAAVATFLLSLVGLVVSVYLTYLELFVIHAVCTWCAVQALAILLIFVVSCYELWLIKHET